jgi:hypothetical protein
LENEALHDKFCCAEKKRLLFPQSTIMQTLGGDGVGLIISSSFKKEETHKGRFSRQVAVEPQQTRNNLQSSSKHKHRTAPANKHPRPKAGVKVRVKPQAVGITGIRAPCETDCRSIGPIPLKHMAQGLSHVTERHELNFRVKPQAVDFTGIRACARQIIEAWAQFH